MNFDRLHAFIELLRKQKQEREIFLSNGFDEESIKELFRSDYRQLYRDAEFYRHLERYIDADFDVPAQSDNRLDTIDEIESPALYEALCSLRPLELEIVLRHSVKGEALTDIAKEKGRPYGSILNINSRAKKKIKDFFKKP